MSLTPEERALAAELGFREEICSPIRAAGDGPLQRLHAHREDGELYKAPALCVRVENEVRAQEWLAQLRPKLEPEGYIPFWSDQYDPGGRSMGTALAAVKATDPYEPLRVCGTNGANFDLQTEDVIAQLKAWDARYRLEVLGASFDWVAMRFGRTIGDLCAFAAEVYLFCPDSVDQGVGLSSPEEDPEAYAEAERLCPEFPEASRRALEEYLLPVLEDDPLPSEEPEESLASMVRGVKLLAREIHRTNGLFLWWD